MLLIQFLITSDVDPLLTYLAKSVKDIYSEVMDKYGRVDILINNAGVVTGNKSFDKIGLAIQDVYSEFKRLDFKNLQFDDAEPGIQQIKTIEQSIEAVNKKIKGIDQEIFQNFISPDTIKTLGEIDNTFDPAIASIEQGLSTVEKKIKEVGQAMKETTSQLEKLDKQRNAAEEDYNKKSKTLSNQKAEKDRISQSLARAQRAKDNGNKVKHVRDLANEFLSPAEIAKINEDVLKGLKPEQAEKSEAWQIAIGLQQVDGLQTSAYLLDTAKEHIEGKLTIDEVQKRVQRRGIAVLCWASGVVGTADRAGYL